MSNQRDRVIGAAVDAITAEAVAKAELIEIGWRAFNIQFVPAMLAPDQVRLLKMAYFCGAQHLWASLFSILSADAEPTPRDMQRMDAIHREMDRWAKQMAEMFLKPTKGHS